MSSVNYTHPLYEQTIPFWAKMRDCIQGEDIVKERGTKYLPVPPGLNVDSKSAEYRNYKMRARFPETVSPAIEGMAGLMGRKLNDPVLPKALQYLYEEATSDGLSLRELEDKIRHEVCSTGRYVLFVDVPTDGGQPYVATYPAEAFINWRTEDDRCTLAVFYEEVEEIDPEDPFVSNYVGQWRVACIEVNPDTGRKQYVVRIWRKSSDASQEQGAFYIEEEFFPTIKGESLDFVPVVVVGSRNLLFEPDAIPLLGVANKSLHYYRQYADYAMQLFMAANGTTPYGTGIAKEDIPRVVGPTGFWSSEAADASFGFAEVSGSGISAQKEELENIKTEIAYATVRVLGDKRAAEAAETLRLRFQSQTATLASIAKTCASGLRRALRFCSEWVGANPDEVLVSSDVEFIAEAPDPQLLQAIYQGIERGYMPDELLIEYARRTGLHDMDVEEYRKWAPFFMAIMPEDEG